MEATEKRAARKAQLMEKPVGELIENILYLEEELTRTREYRKKLIQIRNIITPPEERRKQGRPTKKEEADFI